MNLLETLLSANNGAAVRSLSQQFGIDQQQTVSAIAQLLPALKQGLASQTQQPDALSGLLGALSGGHHQQYLDQPDSLQRQDTVADGNAILGHILGSKDVSRQVASQAAEKTGLGESVLKQMLPLVAAMAMGALSKQTSSQQSNLNWGSSGAGSSGGAAGLLGSLLDQDGDGSFGASDVMGMMGKFLGGR